MREISPRAEPVAFAQWRAGSQNDINYGYDLIPGELKAEIKEALVAEQRGLCAYTGVRIDSSLSHIEHLLPQAHCHRGEEDVAYRNMVALSRAGRCLRSVRRAPEGELAVACGGTSFRFAPLRRL